MSNHEIPHLQDQDLLRLLDGEIPDREASLLEAHVAACWTCRTRMEEFETAIGEYVRYRGSALKPMLPPPPQPWKDLRPEFEQADRSLDAGRVIPYVRQRRLLGLRPAYWAAAAACLIIGWLVIGRFENAPAVKASELLRKASAAPRAGEPNRRIRIKTSHSALIRPALLTAPAVTEADAAQLKQMFDAAHFSWEEPLSASSYAAWHDQLLEKRDEVKTVDQDESADVPVYVIRTSTLASTLRTATLTLRARDLRPMREMLEFSGDTVEITDLPEANETEAARMPARSAAAVAPSRVIVPGGAMPAARRELEVFRALHRIGADLGEPIEIHSSGSELHVIGTGLTPIQEEQLKTALADISGVIVRFDQGTANAGARGTPGDRTSTVTAPMQTRLQALLGSRESAEDFTNRALDSSDAVMARVHALRALARAFPPEVEKGLTVEDTGLLTTLRNDHSAALSQRIVDLQRVLKPLVAQTATSTIIEETPNWQRSVENLFAAAQRVDDALNAALAGSRTAGGDNFGQLAGALARLQSQFAAYEKAGR